MMCPCKDCTERTATCHGNCEKYGSWKKEHDDAREDYNRKNQFPCSFGKWTKTCQGYWRNKKIKRRR